MFERFVPIEPIKFGWSSLVDRSTSAQRLDREAIGLLVAAPLGVGLVGVLAHARLAAPSAILGALSLLTAGTLAAFAQLASIRTQYRLPDTDYDPDKPTRQMLDEAVAHVLTASLLAGFMAVTVLAGMSLGGDLEHLAVWASVVVLVLGTYLGLLFLMIVRKLWGAYELANELDQDERLHR